MISLVSMKTRRLAVVTCSILAVAFAQTTMAQGAAASSPDANDDAVGAVIQPSITPAAQAVLDRMTATLQGLQHFSVSAQGSRDEMLPYGYKLQNNDSAQMLVVRPNRMRVEVNGDIKNRTYIYDGKDLVIYAPDEKVYLQSAAPSTIADLVGMLLDTGVEMPMLDILYQGFSGKLTEQVQSGMVVGQGQIDGTPTDHLAFRQADIDWQLWVEKGQHALPLKMVITTRYALGDPQSQVTMKWNLDPQVSATSFRFVPPKDTMKVPAYAPVAAKSEPGK